MAFAIRNLSVLAYANGFTLWHYKAGGDRLSHVEALDFFADDEAIRRSLCVTPISFAPPRVSSNRNTIQS